MSTPLHVLVACDSRSESDRIATFLDGLGHRPSVTEPGMEALVVLHDIEFDAAVVEVGDAAGLDALRAMRDLAPRMAVLALGRNNPELATKAVRDGAFDVLALPASDAAIATALERGAAKEQLDAATALMRASDAVLESTDPKELVTLIVQLAGRVLMADEVCLWLPERGDGLHLAASDGVEPDVLARRTALAMAIATADTESRTLLLPSEETIPATIVAAFEASKVRAAIAWRLVSRGEVIGVLTIHRTGDPRLFRALDLDRGGVLASQIRLALENERLLQRSVAAERLASVGQLAAAVAHEINNPLTYVLASCSFATEGIEDARKKLERDCSPSSQRVCAGLADVGQALADLSEGARRIRDIANDLRTLARGNVAEREVVDLSEVIRSSLRISGPVARGSTSVIVELEPGLFVSAVPGRLSQVFVNLIVNAAQAAAMCSRSVEIYLTTRREGDRMIATVKDTGCGIPPEHLSKIFEPFFTTKTSTAGTGLGLSISRDIVHEHGGRIVVTSEVGKGTTFELSFPSAAAGGFSVIPPSLPQQRRARWLFIDDDAEMLRTYERVFGREVDVITVCGGRQAIALLTERQDFDVIVCDVEMPERDGADVFTFAQTRGPGLASRFVFVSGVIGNDARRRFVEQTGQPSADKPFDVPKLRAMLRATTAKNAA